MAAFVTVTPQGKRWIQRFCAWSPYSSTARKFVSVSFCPKSGQCPPQEQPAPQSPCIPWRSTGFGWWQCCTSPAVALTRMDRQRQTHFRIRIALLPCLSYGYGMCTPGNGPSCRSLVQSPSPGRGPMPRAGAAPGTPQLPCSWLGGAMGPGCQVLPWHPKKPWLLLDPNPGCAPMLPPSKPPLVPIICFPAASLQTHLHPCSFCPIFYTSTQFPSPLAYHYPLFSSVPLKMCINTPTYSVSCPCHQTNILKNSSTLLSGITVRKRKIS